jgi:hypothetical protein
MAMHWASQGRRGYVVDLDAGGARSATPSSSIVARRCAGAVAGDAGTRRPPLGGLSADRIVVSTLAAGSQRIDRAMVKHRDKIAVSVDARGGRIRQGWLETSAGRAGLHRYLTRVRRIYTDMTRRHDGASGLR